MWTFISNPIITHLFSLFMGALSAWYATHKTALTAAETTVDAVISSIRTLVTTQGAASKPGAAIVQPVVPPPAAPSVPPKV